MIASLRGTLAEKESGHCVVETGGVGYAVSVSSHTARALPEAGEPVFLHTHQVVREDVLQLFGFAELEERKLFELLITVSGVGPKVALAVLSGLEPAALTRALREENIAALVGIPGVGRKTAERLIVELRDKMELIVTASASPVKGRVTAPRSAAFDDAVAALVQLGYSRAQAQDAIRQARGEGDEPSVETMVRQALRQMARPAVPVR